MHQSQETWGGLDCIIVDQLPSGRVPQALVILAHGFGAPGTDLVGLAEVLFELEPQLAEGIRFVFPAARLSGCVHAWCLPGRDGSFDWA